MPGNRHIVYRAHSFNQNLEPQQEKSKNAVEKKTSQKSHRNQEGDQAENVTKGTSVVVKEEPKEIDVEENDVKADNSVDFGTDELHSDDDADIKHFFSDNPKAENCYRLPYTASEDAEIINFVFKGSNLYKTSSILMWKYLAAKKKNPPRTYQSLKNRFLRNIKPNLLTVYRHLIPNDGTLTKILNKFPELKKKAERGERKSLNLPLRAAIMFENEGRIVSVEEKPLEIENASKSSDDVTEEVKTEIETMVITVNSRAEDRNTKRSPGIYETYLVHKQKNKMNPCPTCGGTGFVKASKEGGGDRSETSPKRTDSGTEVNDKTPVKVSGGSSDAGDSTLKERGNSAAQSPSLANTSLGSETNCSLSSDSDSSTSDEQDDANISSRRRNDRKRKKTSKKVIRKKIYYSSDSQISKEEEEEEEEGGGAAAAGEENNISISRLSLRNRGSRNLKNVEPSPAHKDSRLKSSDELHSAPLARGNSSREKRVSKSVQESSVRGKIESRRGV